LVTSNALRGVGERHDARRIDAGGIEGEAQRAGHDPAGLIAGDAAGEQIGERMHFD